MEWVIGGAVYALIGVGLWTWVVWEHGRVDVSDVLLFLPLTVVAWPLGFICLAVEYLVYLLEHIPTGKTIWERK